MLLISHIVIALTSIAISGLAVLAPSRRKIQSSYTATVATIITGTYLVVSTHADLTQACIAGLLFIGFSLACIIAAQHRLAADSSSIKSDKSH